jgi:hypothetical protein
MEQRKATASSTSALNQLKTIGDTFEELVSQGKSSSRVVNFVSDKGYVHLSSQGTRFVIYYSLNATFFFNVTGLDDNDEQFMIQLYDGRITSVDITNLTNGSKRTMSWTFPNPPWFNWGQDLLYRNVSINKWVGKGSRYSLTDAVKIDIKNGTDIEGRIWLFDIGYIRYEGFGSDSSHNIFIENGGVIDANPQGSYLVQQPATYTYTNPLRHFFKCIQLRPEPQTSTGPGGNLKFTMKIKNITITEDQIDHFSVWHNNSGYWIAQNVHLHTTRLTDVNFKIQIFGDHAAAWKNYFTSILDPTPGAGNGGSGGGEKAYTPMYNESNNGMLYADSESLFRFVLSYIPCNLQMKVI